MCVKCQLNRELSVGRKGNLRYLVRIPLLQLDNNNTLIIFYCSIWTAKEVIFLMKHFITLFTASSKELRKIRSITLVSMLGAISIILGSLTIMVGDFLKINFNFLPNNLVFYLFGPVVGAVYGATMDILTFIVRPTGTFFFGFTLSAILTGIIYGIALYNKPVSLQRIFFTNFIHMVLINILLNTYWLTLLIGQGFFILLPIRILKGIIMLPIETLLLYTIIKSLEANGILNNFLRRKSN